MKTPPSFSSTFAPVPLELLSWLRHTDVMTDRLKSYAPQVSLKILEHDWVEANAWELKYLGIEGSLLRRNVLIQSQNQPCWYARTMIPNTTYQRAPEFFDRLHQEPLAHLIYDEPRVTRCWIYSYGISPSQPEWLWWANLQYLAIERLWMRVSAFQFDQDDFFYLAELFLL